MYKQMKNATPMHSGQRNPHIDGKVIQWHNPNGTPTTHQTHINNGTLHIPEYLREASGINTRQTDVHYQ